MGARPDGGACGSYPPVCSPSGYDELLDTIADVCAADDPPAVADLYAREECRVRPGLIG